MLNFLPCLRLHNNDTKPKLDNMDLVRVLCLRLHNNDTKPKHIF